MNDAGLPSWLSTSFRQLALGERAMGPDSWFRTVEPAAVAGILQTKEYATHVVRNNPRGRPAAQLAEAIQFRLARQRIFDGPGAFLIILGEEALLRPVGSRQEMAAQCRHLVSTAQRPNVTIQVFPFAEGPIPGLGESFVILDVPERGTLLYREDVAGGRAAFNSIDLRLYATMFAQICSRALSPEKSLLRLEQACIDWGES